MAFEKMGLEYPNEGRNLEQRVKSLLQADLTHNLEGESNADRNQRWFAEAVAIGAKLADLKERLGGEEELSHHIGSENLRKFFEFYMALQTSVQAGKNLEAEKRFEKLEEERKARKELEDSRQNK
ncbi:hypothetical protein KKD19_05615 [Patescibacteria group bacterium]|nr:hypothetical protein [Patescibacteria group bacterium]MBU4512683.1 hypothetical protein [Patescibacteria group bacterium]MCG2693585.1 hypothetical protein [Candidatus Parcubacteria bacterium]